MISYCLYRGYILDIIINVSVHCSYVILSLATAAHEYSERLSELTTG